AGLQDIAPIVTKRWVTSAVFAAIRAAALAASQPAWPPPITMTSKESDREIMWRLLSRSQKVRKRESQVNPRDRAQIKISKTTSCKVECGVGVRAGGRELFHVKHPQIGKRYLP